MSLPLSKKLSPAYAHAAQLAPPDAPRFPGYPAAYCCSASPAGRAPAYVYLRLWTTKGVCRAPTLEVNQESWSFEWRGMRYLIDPSSLEIYPANGSTPTVPPSEHAQHRAAALRYFPPLSALILGCPPEPNPVQAYRYRRQEAALQALMEARPGVYRKLSAAGRPALYRIEGGALKLVRARQDAAVEWALQGADPQALHSGMFRESAVGIYAGKVMIASRQWTVLPDGELHLAAPHGGPEGLAAIPGDGEMRPIPGWEQYEARAAVVQMSPGQQGVFLRWRTPRGAEGTLTTRLRNGVFTFKRKRYAIGPTGEVVAV